MSGTDLITNKTSLEYTRGLGIFFMVVDSSKLELFTRPAMAFILPTPTPTRVQKEVC
jgi:hypothetical protein